MPDVLGEPTPNEADRTGESYAFEKRVTKAGLASVHALVGVDVGTDRKRRIASTGLVEATDVGGFIR